MTKKVYFSCFTQKGIPFGVPLLCRNRIMSWPDQTASTVNVIVTNAHGSEVSEKNRPRYSVMRLRTIGTELKVRLCTTCPLASTAETVIFMRQLSAMYGNVNTS